MPKHIVRLVSLLVGFIIIGLVARWFVIDPSFYKYGTYRADSVPEIAAPIPKIRGPEHCQSCHVDRYAEWSAGTHSKVNCEICHGNAAREHPDNYPLPIAEDTIKLCTLCHEQMPARPAFQPQIVVAEHPFPHEGDLQCKNCHNPHSPRIGGAPPSATANNSADTTDEVAANPAGVSKAATPKVTATVAPPVSKPKAATPEVKVPVAQPASTPKTAPPKAPAAAANCSGCHGPQGLGVAPFPPIAGLDAKYLSEQISRYKSGDRVDPMGMMGMAVQTLSDTDITELAAYYAALEGAPPM